MYLSWARGTGFLDVANESVQMPRDDEKDTKNMGTHFLQLLRADKIKLPKS